MKIESTEIEDVKLITQFRHEDERGVFVKPFHASDFKKAGIDFELKECFYSTSKKNVVRGMHFHLPPFDHAKIVFCTEGEILDVALDLQKNKGTYGKFISRKLSFEKSNAMYIPKGFAHGFLSLSATSTLVYFVDGEYQKEADAGIHFESFGMDWNDENKILSLRDRLFIPLKDFESPF